MLILAPLALLYPFIVLIRRCLYRWGLKKTQVFEVPVVVVGNITVGGTGKTPLVAALVSYLRTQGYYPGLVSRGYGGSKNRHPTLVSASSSAQEVGDEALMLVQKTQAPFCIGVDRVAAVRTLLQQHPDCDVVISDDGLQHWALGRAIDIAVLDERLEGCVGSQYYFPWGALREGRGRLKTVDFIIRREDNLVVPSTPSSDQLPSYRMKVVPTHVCQIVTGKTLPLEYLAGRAVQAVAGIGRPERFFEDLKALGCSRVDAYPFPDHHQFRAEELDAIRSQTSTPFIVMTEKDAVKCRAFAADTDWYLVVRAQLEDAFFKAFNQELNNDNARTDSA